MSYSQDSLRGTIQGLFQSDPELTLKQVAEHLQIDRHTIERAFRSNGGTFRDARTKTRFEYLCNLLCAEPPLSLKEVAITLGYSPRSLSRFALRVSGRTPTELREHLQHMVSDGAAHPAP